MNVANKVILVSMFFIYSFLNAQVLNIDEDLHQKLSEMKESRYQKLFHSDNKMTKNQADYDAKYYSLDLNLDPVSEILTGTVEMVLEVVATSLNQVDLNLWTGMAITDIHQSLSPGTQLAYTHSNDLLVIDLGSSYSQGQQVSLVISYNGSPQNSNYSSFGYDTYSGQPMIWTRSEPYGARAWWPCKDIPADKADSVDIRITAPSYLTVASNGTLRDTTTIGNVTSWWWHEQYPIVTYLVSIDVYPYTFYQEDYIYNNNADTMKINFYVFPNNYNTYYSTNALVKDMIACFDSLYGPYPFIEEKYGHADDLGGGAMEHQTCSSFSFWGETVYAHELAHQWWGDLITCNSFHHIWLNEGFATYSEALWYEYAYPPYTASEYQMTVNHYLGPGTIYVEDPYTQVIFHGGLSYNKGSWVVHMIRGIMGDSLFFNFLHSYYASVHQFGTATTEDFQLLCEQATGLDLNDFFQQWIYGEYYPQYSYGYTFYPETNGYRINLQVDQVQQNTGLFWMPIDIRVTTNNYDTTFVVWDSLQSQSFDLFIADEPISVELDPENWILKESEQHLIAPYTQNTTINNPYQNPVIDTLVVLSEIVNPTNHNVNVKAIITSEDNAATDTVFMFDDGLHQDSIAGDGLYGGIWPVPSGEKFYNIGMMTVSLDSGYYNIINNSVKFTTVGPVVLYNYQITTPDTIPNPGDVIRTQFTIKNESVSDSVYNITSRITALDTNATPVVLVIPAYGDLAPGEMSVGDNQQLIRFNANCLDSTLVNIQIELYSDTDLFWTDTLSFFLTTDPSGFEITQNQIPTEYGLKQNYPNPFNPSTIIEFSVPKKEYVTLRIYNLLGQEVATLASEEFKPGSYTFSWDAVAYAGGIYFYKLEARNYSETRKMILMK